ncbi:MAG: carboxypeptidase M32 [Phycisphaerae bacterium]|nr:carboxypeptidase M32 [Phycisphaerae bacterium]
MPSETYGKFVSLTKDYAIAGQIGGLLGWDQETCMPEKGAADRSNQLAFIAGIEHERQTSAELGNLLDKLEQEADEDVVVATNVRETRREYDRAIRVPTDLVKEIARVTSLAQDAWRKARAESNFALFVPTLERLLDLKRQVADKIGWKTEPFDALMDEYEPGTKAADVQVVFDRLKTKLVPFVAAIKDAPRRPDLSILKRPCPIEQQKAFTRRVLEAMQFDFKAGRVDTSTHPFCSGATPNDVRLTSRYFEDYFPASLFGLMHEGGHGLYEQGLDAAHVGTPMGSSVSLGIHESQSRLWENQVGRSRAFWERFYGEFQAAFASMADVPLDDFYFAINNVKPSFIRVEADEVTYGLHIMLRFAIERPMIAGTLAVRDIPEKWNALSQELLGITPSNDAEGCLQDIHWAFGMYGYFPTYQLGNLYSAQFFAAAKRAMPGLEDQIRRGELAPLREWLRENIHRHGKRYRAPELAKLVTGSTLADEPYMEYLEAKYKPLYGI